MSAQVAVIVVPAITLYDICAAVEIVKLIEEARIYKDNLKSVFVVNRKIANTAIGRDVEEALAAYAMPVLAASITQRVIFAQAVTQGLGVFEMDPQGQGAAEIEAVVAELLKMEFTR